MMENKAKEPFFFYTRHNLTYLTGKKARNLGQLLQAIKEAPSSSIYHHTHHYLQQHEYLSPEPPNDFAYWVNNVLGDKMSGEMIASIDLRQFVRLGDIKQRIIEVIEYCIGPGKASDRTVPEGQEFHFMKAQTFVMPTKNVAGDLREFKTCMEKISTLSLYYHMFESRLRLQKQTNDFSVWLRESLSEMEIAGKIEKLDPYTYTHENLRKTLVGYMEKRLGER
jgi:hypothetical protein